MRYQVVRSFFARVNVVNSKPEKYDDETLQRETRRCVFSGLSPRFHAEMRFFPNRETFHLKDLEAEVPR